MRFISYAQNREDVILWRSFKNVSNGFYIDVGANDPEIDSVTKAFYDLGWSGINIEPVKQWYDLLCEQRSRDINLNFAAGKEDGILTLYEIPDTGLSTSSKSTAQRHLIDNGFKNHSTTVLVKTLTSIVQDTDCKAIHFLKIDVEGAEKDVLLGIDFRIIRPWILLIESMEPYTQKENHGEWESIVLNAGYKFVYLDGINRFYVADEHIDLQSEFSAPPNYFDNFELASEKQLRDSVIKANNQIARLRGDLNLHNIKEDNYINQINTLHNSISWRLTKPMRLFGYYIIKIREYNVFDGKRNVDLLRRLLRNISRFGTASFFFLKRITNLILKKIIKFLFGFLESHPKIRNKISSLGKKIGLKTIIVKIYYHYEKHNLEEKNIEINNKFRIEMNSLSPCAKKILFDLKTSIAAEKDHD